MYLQTVLFLEKKQMILQKKYIYVLFLSLFYTAIQAQVYCSESTAQEYIQNSEMKVLFRSGGDMFWDGEQTAKFQIPYAYGQTPTNTIFAGATWMGAYDTGGNLYVAAQTYRSRGNDYWAGPIDVSSGTPVVTSCTSFDKIWKVRRWAIDQHIADYNDNGIIDGPTDLSLLKWPGKGNPQFAAQMGFLLPANQDLAPFYDRNGDGNYQPLNGDYPVFEHGNGNALAEEILWSVFNDMGNLHTETNGQVMKVEVQQTAYVFSCPNHPVLNNTLFVKHKVINKSGRDYQDYYYGVWTDFDLGCSEDDYYGTIPSKNTIYAYNADNDDAVACAAYGTGYGIDPPVQAITILNHSLASSIYYVNNGPLGDPVNALGYYRPLTGKWKNGTPLTVGGNGYNPASTTNPVTNYAFPDNPNDSSGWSMYAESLSGFDLKTIGSVYKDTLRDGEIFTIDLAYSYHRDPDSNHLQNVNLMYQEVDTIQDYYNNNFSTIRCGQSTYCATSCVYPGDANNNGLDNDFDVLEMGLNYGNTAATRSVVGDQWFPHEPPVPATNAYVDTNGDNVVDTLDFMVNTENWQETHPLYNGNQEGADLIGTDLFFDRFYLPPPFSLDTIVPTYKDAILTINLGDSIQNITDLYGVTFRVSYDADVFWLSNGANQFFSAGFRPWLGEDGATIYSRQINEPGKIHYVTTRLDQTNYTGGGEMGQIILKVKPTAPVSVVSTPTEVCFEDFKAIRADGSTISIGAECITILYQNLNFNSINKVSKTAPVISLYPNPINYQLNIDLGTERAKSIQLFNLLGEEIRSFENVSGIVEIPKNNLAQGMYTVVVHFENGTHSSHKVLFN
jgi:hypothetical protein